MKHVLPQCDQIFDHNCSFLTGSGAADRSEAHASAAQSARGVQERHLPAPDAETETAD